VSDLLRDAFIGQRRLPDPRLSARAHRLARVTQGLLVAYAAVLVSSIAANVAFPFVAEVPVTLVLGATFVATAISFAWWTTTMYRVTPDLGGAPVEYATWWAWVGFILPIANLFRPYQIVKEIEEATDPEALDPAAGRAGADVSVGLWWGLWLVAGLVGRLLKRIPEPGPLDDDRAYLAVGVVSMVLWLGATAAAFLVVRRIDRGQAEVEALLAEAERRAAAESPAVGFTAV